MNFLCRAYYFSICINGTRIQLTASTVSLEHIDLSQLPNHYGAPKKWQSSCHGQTLSLLAHKKSQSCSVFLSHCQ